jgi:hypothetical protein
VVKTYRLSAADVLADTQADRLKGTFLDDRHYDLFLSHEDADVLRPDGTPLLLVRHGALPADVCRAAFPALKRAARPTHNRGIAAGTITSGDQTDGTVLPGAVAAGTRFRIVRADGTLSHTTYAKWVSSGIIGYYDRAARTPFCRTTEYTRRDVAGWTTVLPFLRAVDGVFRRGCPVRYAAQLAAVRDAARVGDPGDGVHHGHRERELPDGRPQGRGGPARGVRSDERPAGGRVLGRAFGLSEVPGGRGPAVPGRPPGRRSRMAREHRDPRRAGPVRPGLDGPLLPDRMRHCLPPAEEVRRAKLRRPGDPLNDRRTPGPTADNNRRHGDSRVQDEDALGNTNPATGRIGRRTNPSGTTLVPKVSPKLQPRDAHGHPTAPPAGIDPPGEAERAGPGLEAEPDLIAAVRRDVRSVGLVGESDAALLVYLAYSSRKLARPLSVIVKGPSGSGKDEIQRKPAELMPPDDVLDVMSLTPQALYYEAAGWLRHKVLLGGERRHEDDNTQRDRTAAVRQLLSHGYITKQTVIDGKGVRIRQDGPVSYSETTTKDSVFAEDANRCLQVNTDPSARQTRDVLRARAEAYRPGGNSTAADRAAVRQRHHDFQRSLADCEVRIPYAGALSEAMPTGRIEVRRVFGHVLTLIEAVAYLHQRHRGRKSGGQLLATADDYALARRLILGPLHAVIGMGDDRAKAGAFLKKLPAGEFDSNRAAQSMEANSRKVAHQRLKKLAEVGAVECIDPGSGNRPARWRKTGKELDEALLPGVETIRAACL